MGYHHRHHPAENYIHAVKQQPKTLDWGTTAPIFTITFDDTSAMTSGNNDPITVTYGETINTAQVNTPNKTDHNFVGYFSYEYVAFYDKDGKLIFNVQNDHRYNKADNTILYAHFIPDYYYYITLENHEGSGGLDSSQSI